MRRAITATVVGVAALTALVLGGVLNGIDEWAMDNVMPALDPTSGSSGLVSTSGVWRPFPLGSTWWIKVLDIYNYPASVLPSVLLLVFLTVTLARRRRSEAAVIWIGAWVAVNVVELGSKHWLTRPALHWTNGVDNVHVDAFGNSFPSGHMARSVVVAAFIAFVFPRLRWPAAVWLLFVPVSLVVSAAHVVSDVVGGTLLGLLLVLLAAGVLLRYREVPAVSGQKGVERRAEFVGK